MTTHETTHESAAGNPWPDDLPALIGGRVDLERRHARGLQAIARELGTAPVNREENYSGAKDAIANVLTAQFGAFGAYDLDGSMISNPRADINEARALALAAVDSWAGDAEDYTADTATSAAELARRAVSYLTEEELSPSTRDLLTLGGIEADSEEHPDGPAFEEAEKIDAIREIMSAYGATPADLLRQTCRGCGKSFPYDPDADYCPDCVRVNEGPGIFDHDRYAAAMNARDTFEGDAGAQLICETLRDRGYQDAEERMESYAGDFWSDFVGPMVDRVADTLYGYDPPEERQS